MAQILPLRPHAERSAHGAFSRILLSGKAFVADVSGALYWPAEETLIVSDLRLANCSGQEKFGRQMPINGVCVTASKLAKLIDKYSARRVVVVGDSLPDAASAKSMGAEELSKLRKLQWDVDLNWVAKEAGGDIAAVVGGRIVPELTIGGITLRQTPVLAPICHEIAGGMAPEAKISREGRPLRSRCFVSTGTRLVMPSFVDSSGGINILDDIFDPVFHRDTIFAWMVGWSDVQPVAARQLLED